MLLSVLALLTFSVQGTPIANVPNHQPSLTGFRHLAEFAELLESNPDSMERRNIAFRNAIPKTGDELLMLCLYTAAVAPRLRRSSAHGLERSERLWMSCFLVARGFSLTSGEARRVIDDKGLAFILSLCFTDDTIIDSTGVRNYKTKGYGGIGPEYLTMFSATFLDARRVALVKAFDPRVNGADPGTS